MSPLVLVVGAEDAGSEDWSRALEAHGYRLERVRAPADAESTVRGDRPVALIVVRGRGGSDSLKALREMARRHGIPTLDVVEEEHVAADLAMRELEAEDWVFRARAASELPARLCRLVRRTRTSPSPSSARPMADARFLALVVHDLRTPLNVIGLSLRMVGQALPKGDPDLDEDLRFIEENFKQIERMLAQLSDYCRLYDGDIVLNATPFSPKRLVEELVEGRSSRWGSKSAPVHVEIHESCPPEVTLDQQRARLAIQYALSNTVAAAGEGRVVVTLRGAPDRWITEIALDRPAPTSVQSVALQPQAFERLCGTAAERRGMDLAISARISELFGGTARLDVAGDRSSVVILDWPAQTAPAVAWTAPVQTVAT